MTTVGVDGWRHGWVAATAHNGPVQWQTYEHFDALLGDHPTSTVAVDMPIGLGDGRRAADDAARSFLREHGGPPSSIFSTPPRHVVDAWTTSASYRDAMASVPRGQRTSIQAWYLIAKIRDLRDALETCAHADVLEAHPECTFRLIDPTTPHASKKTGLGVARRLAVLERVGLAVDLQRAPDGVPVDDLLDAAVLIHTARRYETGGARFLPARTPPHIVV